MVFTHDTESALQAAVELANSALDSDSLGTTEALAEFVERWGYSGRHDGTEVELEEVRATRPALRALLLAERDDAAERVNAILADAPAFPQLARHGRHDWHIHAVAPGESLALQILVETAMAMVDVIRADEMSRLAVCADESCEGIVLDLSRNRSRRFCSTACGNRNAVAAYRARQAER
ncbi:CGNR zinc finger domain-containing protein [Actinotalea sp.]|uniref:CGNR zinc finger domain-containing protein n=1 Tax=Actinotalea sp. TaxID=1872145 RepID=UPI0035673CC1